MTGARHAAVRGLETGYTAAVRRIAHACTRVTTYIQRRHTRSDRRGCPAAAATRTARYVIGIDCAAIDEVVGFQ